MTELIGEPTPDSLGSVTPNFAPPGRGGVLYTIFIFRCKQNSALKKIVLKTPSPPWRGNLKFDCVVRNGVGLMSKDKNVQECDARNVENSYNVDYLKK